MGKTTLSSLPGLDFTHGWMRLNPRINPWASTCRLSEASSRGLLACDLGDLDFLCLDFDRGIDEKRHQPKASIHHELPCLCLLSR